VLSGGVADGTNVRHLEKRGNTSMKVQKLPPDPQFAVLRVLYQRDRYTIAWVEFGKGRTHVLGERWDGETDADAGYPVGRGGTPKWMVVSQHLVRPRLKELLGEKGTDNEAVLWALQDFSAHAAVPPVTYGNNVLAGCPACGEPFIVSAFAQSYFTPRTLDVIETLQAHPMTEAQVAEKLGETPRYVHEVIKNILPGGPNVGAGIVANFDKHGIVTLTSSNRECPSCGKSVARAEYDEHGVVKAVLELMPSKKETGA
jgi:hypothetical protein